MNTKNNPSQDIVLADHQPTTPPPQDLVLEDYGRAPIWVYEDDEKIIRWFE